MGRLPSLVRQVQEKLEEKRAYGEKKHTSQNKENKIFSYSTFDNYLDAGAKFAKYIQKNYNHIRTLEDAKKYTNEYIEQRLKTVAKTSVSRDISALQKLYGATRDEISTIAFTRQRSEITKNRSVNYDKVKFDEAVHKNLVSFLKATGLRRHEFENLKIEDINADMNTVYVRQGKGGKSREISVLERHKGILEVFKYNLINEQKTAPFRTPYHVYRRDYAQSTYKYYERDLAKLESNQKYHCRLDKKGVVYDRKAMMITSQNLGHNRVDVIAKNYL